MTIPSRLRLPSGPVRNAQLAAATGQDVLLVAVLAVTPGEAVRLTFEQVNSPWRQGVWLGTEGLLVVAGQSSNQFVLWSDTAPRDLEIVVERTHGALRLYNVWDSGRGLGRFESQRSTSGMIQTKRDDGSLEFRCTDIGTSPNFSKLVFSILVGRSLGDWTFVVEEVSNLVFRARGTDIHGRSVERTGSGHADEVLAEAHTAARELMAEPSLTPVSLAASGQSDDQPRLTGKELATGVLQAILLDTLLSLGLEVDDLMSASPGKQLELLEAAVAEGRVAPDRVEYLREVGLIH